MSYLAFALKYRPANFDEVVGQDQIVISLKNAITQNRIHHAYLFSGPRGVGKTSMARILAKSLNCENGPAVKPCEKCPSCKEISRGTSLDIIEIDGASNRGIDDIRTLRENVRLSPAHSRYKIYIIDEVHQITSDGFNALLKTLEEPPAHVKFIFATTHPQKVLPTILSRCQKFSFHLVSVEEIVGKLTKIAEAEGLRIEKPLFYAIARSGGGSIRDCESLLDQLAPVVLEKGVVRDVFSFLGIIDEETLNTFLTALIERNLTVALDFVNKTVQEGKDLGVFINSLLEHLRHLLLVKVSPRAFDSLSEISPQSKQIISGLSKSITVSRILKIMDLLIEAKDLSRRLNTIRIPLELAIVKGCYKETEEESAPPAIAGKQTVEVENKSLPVVSGETPAVSQNNTIEAKDFDFYDDVQTDISAASSGVIKTKGMDKQQPVIDNEDNNEEEDISGTNDLLLNELRTQWSKIIYDMQKIRAAIASHLSYGQPVSASGKVIKIRFVKKDSFHKEIVEYNKNTIFVEEMISKKLGKSLRVKFVIAEDTAVQSGGTAAAREEGKPAKKEETPKLPAQSEDDFISDLLDTFDGKLHTEDE